jgi:hypothetical protein
MDKALRWIPLFIINTASVINTMSNIIVVLLLQLTATSSEL